MKKLLKVIVILIVIVAALFWAGSRILEYGAKRSLPVLRSLLNDRGLQVRELDFSKLRFTSYNRLTIFDCQTALAVPGGEMPIESSFYAGRVDLELTALAKPAVRLSCDQFSIFAERNRDIPGTTFGRLDHGYWSSGKAIEIRRLGSEVNRYLAQLQQLFNEEFLDTDMRLRAQVTLISRGRQAQAYLYTVQEAQGTRLRFETADIQKAAEIFALDLSPDEVEIIALFPMRAPIIMRLTSDARTTGKNARRLNPAVPEDAYRHVLWSYLLTRQFDPAFAEQVTNAHEVLPTNTAAERRMDFINNRIGRSYAQRGVPQDRILSLVMSDPQVVRRPQEAEFKN
mgnify:CR=1 FL=1